MIRLKIISMAVLVLILQSTLVKLISIYDVMPDLVIIFCVFVALKFGPVAGIFIGFTMGLIEDVYQYQYLGAMAWAKSITGFLVGLLEENVLKLNFITQVLVLGAAFLIHDFLFSWAIQQDSLSLSNILLYKTLPNGIYTIALGAIIFYLMSSSRDLNVG